MYDYICIIIIITIIIIIIPSQSSWLTSINPIPSSNRRGSTGPAAFLAERALGTTFRCEGVWAQGALLSGEMSSTVWSNSSSHMLHVCYIYLHYWVIFGANIGKYSIHGAYGLVISGDLCIKFFRVVFLSQMWKNTLKSKNIIVKKDLSISLEY